MSWYPWLVVGVAAERLVELWLSRRNAAWAFANGGVERGAGHYRVMTALHTAFLLACLLEPWLAERPFVPAVGWPALGLVLASQGLRYWAIWALGRRWNTRVIVLPGWPLVRRGPYRWLRHPNYLAVIVELAALPLVHSAWATALVFTVANLLLLRVRVAVEEAALGPARAWTSGPDSSFSKRHHA